MRLLESRTSKIRLAAAITLLGGACQFTPEPNPNDFTFRVSVAEASEAGELLNDKILNCFSDDAGVDTQERSGEVIVFMNTAYCPDKKLNNRYIGSSDTQFESITTDQLNMDFIRIEMLNQYETYLKCDLPVPPPFKSGKTCAD